ncbi:hypothetical protein H5410_001613 [Solanum commersonii]|uniref:Uncharacterized protein n=1 Tax=Solanum commersonii TaxID=4109 RepID=A0A9J6AZI7_SOLCO|nr:hypothetical protein H5410_001613 [Solanum commersonii]
MCYLEKIYSLSHKTVPTPTPAEVSDVLPNAESTPSYYTNSPTEPELHSQVSDGVDEPVIGVQEAVLPANPRRSTRPKHTPTWLKDFVSLNIHSDVKYPFLFRYGCGLVIGLSIIYIMLSTQYSAWFSRMDVELEHKMLKRMKGTRKEISV